MRLCHVIFALQLIFGFSLRIEISKQGTYLEIAEVTLFHKNLKIPSNQLSFQLSSTDSKFYFPSKLCNNGNILDFCTTSSLDEFPKLEITNAVLSEGLVFDKIVVYNRLIDLGLRNRINDATIKVLSNNNQTIWEGDFGNSSSMKYEFNVDLDRCATKQPNQIDSCLHNSPITVNHETFSQLGQDEFAIEFFNEMRNGFFVDFGANDGVSLSNSYALEKNYGWRGIAVEPLPKHHKNLMVTRNCTILNVCASNSSGFKEFRVVTSDDEYSANRGFDADMLSGMVDTWVWQKSLEDNVFSLQFTALNVYCVKTQEIFDHFHVTHIDYMSVDAEGAELSILQGIDWSRMDITLIHVDFNQEDTAHFLQSRGYKLLQLGHDICAIKIR